VTDRWSASAAFLWPALAAASASEVASIVANQLAQFASDSYVKPASTPDWASRNHVALELPTMRLRDFSSTRARVPTLICAPFALHGATIADFERGHSLIEALQSCGLTHLFATEWRSATPEMQFFSIDNYLADLNVAVDELGGSVEMIGLCQGGWMALLYASRFPAKVRRIVLAGAPIDTQAEQAGISLVAANTPPGVFKELVRLGNGCVLGRHALVVWQQTSITREEIYAALQLPADASPQDHVDLIDSFRNWYAWTVDLPGAYYLQVVERLFRNNEIVRGRFTALGHRVDLSDIHVPIFMLAGRDDQLVAPRQMFAIEHFVATPPSRIETAVAPCDHLALFMGTRTLTEIWPRIARWMIANETKRDVLRGNGRARRPH